MAGESLVELSKAWKGEPGDKRNSKYALAALGGSALAPGLGTIGAPIGYGMYRNSEKSRKERAESIKRAKEERERKEREKAKKKVKKDDSLVDLSKGLFSPVKGIKGGAITRRFPEMTASGKRQLANKKNEAKALNERIAQGAAAQRQAWASDNARRNAGFDKFKRSGAGVPKPKPANFERLPADMQGATTRSGYYT